MKYFELFVFVIVAVLLYKFISAYLKLPTWATL